jgi:hypothetical protein
MTNVFFVHIDADHRLRHRRNQRQRRNRLRQRSHLLRLRQRSHLLRLRSHLLRPKNLDGSKDVKPARAGLLAQ